MKSAFFKRESELPDYIDSSGDDLPVGKEEVKKKKINPEISGVTNKTEAELRKLAERGDDPYATANLCAQYVDPEACASVNQPKLPIES